MLVNTYRHTLLFKLELAACAFLIAACSAMTPRPVMPISEIISLSADPEQAIKRASASKTTYALRGSDFGRLADAGVAPKVLDHLQQSFVNDVDFLTRYWVLGESLGGCGSCYPQPVDLGNLASGGNGMADASGVARSYTYSKPQGLPDWVSAYPGSVGAPAITVAEVEQMVKQGVAGEELAARIRGSRLHDIIGMQGLSRISTHYAAGLTGSDLARLHNEGASDDVLDALQQKFLAEFIEFDRLRYQSLGKGPGSFR